MAAAIIDVAVWKTNGLYSDHVLLDNVISIDVHLVPTRATVNTTRRVYAI